MKKINIKRIIPIAVAVLVVAAAVAVIAGIGSARAELTERSDVYTARMAQDDIGISLIENGNVVSSRNYNTSSQDGSWSTTGDSTLLSHLPEKIVMNQAYPEEIQVANSGTIDEYVRITIRRYWLTPAGEEVPVEVKQTALKPELIEIHLVEGTGWLHDTNADTDERMVFYYSSILRSGESTDLLTDTITINNEVAQYLTQTVTGNKIVTTYDYDGYQFCLEATADAVQDHNAQDAARSAWGRPVTIDEAAGTLTLN